MTAITRPTLAARMCDGYLQAAIFALEAEVDADRTVTARRKDLCAEDEGTAGYDAVFAAYGVSVLAREYWREESARCEGICGALSGMIEP